MLHRLGPASGLMISIILSDLLCFNYRCITVISFSLSTQLAAIVSISCFVLIEVTSYWFLLVTHKVASSDLLCVSNRYHNLSRDDYGFISCCLTLSLQDLYRAIGFVVLVLWWNYQILYLVTIILSIDSFNLILLSQIVSIRSDSGVKLNLIGSVWSSVNWVISWLS